MTIAGIGTGVTESPRHLSSDRAITIVVKPYDATGMCVKIDIVSLGFIQVHFNVINGSCRTGRELKCRPYVASENAGSLVIHLTNIAQQGLSPGKGRVQAEGENQRDQGVSKDLYHGKYCIKLRIIAPLRR